MTSKQGVMATPEVISLEDATPGLPDAGVVSPGPPHDAEHAALISLLRENSIAVLLQGERMGSHQPEGSYLGGISAEDTACCLFSMDPEEKKAIKRHVSPTASQPPTRNTLEVISPKDRSSDLPEVGDSEFFALPTFLSGDDISLLDAGDRFYSCMLNTGDASNSYTQYGVNERFSTTADVGDAADPSPPDAGDAPHSPPPNRSHVGHISIPDASGAAYSSTADAGDAAPVVRLAAGGASTVSQLHARDAAHIPTPNRTDSAEISFSSPGNGIWNFQVHGRDPTHNLLFVKEDVAFLPREKRAATQQAKTTTLMTSALSGSMLDLSAAEKGSSLSLFNTSHHGTGLKSIAMVNITKGYATTLVASHTTAPLTTSTYMSRCLPQKHSLQQREHKVPMQEQQPGQQQHPSQSPLTQACRAGPVTSDDTAPLSSYTAKSVPQQNSFLKRKSEQPQQQVSQRRKRQAGDLPNLGVSSAYIENSVSQSNFLLERDYGESMRQAQPRQQRQPSHLTPRHVMPSSGYTPQYEESQHQVQPHRQQQRPSHLSPPYTAPLKSLMSPSTPQQYSFAQMSLFGSSVARGAPQQQPSNLHSLYTTPPNSHELPSMPQQYSVPQTEGFNTYVGPSLPQQQPSHLESLYAAPVNGYISHSMPQQSSFLNRGQNNSQRQAQQRQSQPSHSEIPTLATIKKPSPTTMSGGFFSRTYPRCPRGFETADLLAKHKLKTHRVGNIVSRASTTQSGPHICAQIHPHTLEPCNRPFRQPSSSTSHENEVHNPVRERFVCGACRVDKQFTRREYLVSHYHKHDPELPLPLKEWDGKVV